MKGWLGRRRWRWIRSIRREFRGRIDRYKRTSKGHVRGALLADPGVADAVRRHARETGVSEAAAWQRVRSYVEEIVPSFNLASYYRLGYGVARVLIPLFFKVSVGYEARDALDAIPRSSVVVYLMNHRSNADYVVVAYVLSGRVALSYAVGEWARVWPLEAVFKSFGSYFVRRRYREALYHRVLERYVQLITRNGVTQGVFLEGGLTRDGRLREPKLGLLDYLVRVKAEPGFDRPFHIIPVAINFDRVLEDRSLLRELQPEAERLPRREQVREVASYVVKVSTRFLLRRARRYGRACVNFGAPLDVDAWLAERPGVLDLPKEERLPRLKELADDVMGRIAAIMPVTPVPLAATTLLRHPGERLTRGEWERALDRLRDELRTAGAHVVGEERTSAEILDRALVMLTLRRVVVAEEGAFRVDRGEDALLRYYANSIAHLLEGEVVRLADAVSAPAVEVGSFRAGDGTRIAWTRLRTGSRGLVVVSPGILMDRGGPEHRLLAKRLRDRFDVLTVDARGHGDSGGAFTFGVREPDDLAALVRSVRPEYERVGGLGFSFGGFHTIVAAARHEVFDAVAVVGTPHRLFVFDHSPFTGGLWRNLMIALRRRRRRIRLDVVPRGWPAVPSRLVSRIAPRPLLVAHGTDDWLIPVSHAHRLHRAAGEPKELALIEGGLHAENMLVEAPEPLLRALTTFFERRLSVG